MNDKIKNKIFKMPYLSSEICFIAIFLKNKYKIKSTPNQGLQWI
jgi:hypothetical protein